MWVTARFWWVRFQKIEEHTLNILSLNARCERLFPKTAVIWFGLETNMFHQKNKAFWMVWGVQWFRHFSRSKSVEKHNTATLKKSRITPVQIIVRHTLTMYLPQETRKSFHIHIFLLFKGIFYCFKIRQSQNPGVFSTIAYT